MESTNSAPTIRCLGLAVLIACKRDSPVRLVLISDTTARVRVIPSQIAMYSGQFAINNATTSPGPISSATAQRPY